MPFITPKHETGPELPHSAIWPSSNVTNSSRNDISLDDTSSYVLSPASANEQRSNSACMLATDLAAEAPEAASVLAMPTKTNAPLVGAALPQHATPASFASVTDKLIANYAMQVEELRFSLAAALEENISMAKEHAIVLASLERRTRDAEAIAQAALAHHDQHRQEQQEQQHSLAQDSPRETSNLNASGRRVSFAAPTSPLPSMLRQAAKLSEGVAPRTSPPGVPPDQHAVAANGLDHNEAGDEEHAASYDASPTPSPLPRSAYTLVVSNVERDGTQSCVDLAAENTTTPVCCINLADEDTTVEKSVDTAEMPMAVYDENTAANPTRAVAATETATAPAVGMVPEEKQTSLAKDQEEEPSVQAPVDAATEEQHEDKEIVPDSAAADSASAFATSARLADRQAERRHSMAAFEQRVQAAKASSPLALQNSQSAVEEVRQMACGSNDESINEDCKVDCRNDEGKTHGNEEGIDKCSVDSGCFDGGDDIKNDASISNGHNRAASTHEDAVVAVPSNSLGGAPKMPTAAGQEAEAPVACRKAPSASLETIPVAATTAPSTMATLTASDSTKEVQAAAEVTSSYSPLPPYEPWELSPSVAAAAVATTGTVYEPAPKPKPAPPAPPPVPFRVSQIVWALDSRAPVDSPTAFWPAKVSALSFKPVPSSASSGEASSASDVPSCESSAPGRTTTGAAARNSEDSSKVVPGEWWLDVKFYTNYAAVPVAACNVKAWSDHQESARASAVGALSVLRQVTGNSSHPSHKFAAAPPGKKNKREAARSVAIAAARQEIANLEEAKVFAKRQAEVKALRQRQQKEEKRKEAKQDEVRKPSRKEPNQQAQLESPPLPEQQQGKEPVGHMAVAAARAAAGDGRSSRPTSPVERLQALNFELQVRLENDKSLQSKRTPKQASGMEVGSSESNAIEGTRRANAAELAPQSVRRSARVQPQSRGVCGCNPTNAPAGEVRRSSSRTTSRSTSSSGSGHLCDSCRASASSFALARGSRSFAAADSSELIPATTPFEGLAKSSEANERQLRPPLSIKKNSQTTESLTASNQLNDSLLANRSAVKLGSSSTNDFEKENVSAERVPSSRTPTIAKNIVGPTARAIHSPFH